MGFFTLLFVVFLDFGEVLGVGFFKLRTNLTYFYDYCHIWAMYSWPLSFHPLKTGTKHTEKEVCFTFFTRDEYLFSQIKW